ncbi:hypothetical protein ACQR2L_05020 [Clostridium butyricum]|uniref:hypothetical protein n=1 Tax=Clostridium butyricum TaxID=1492 RepID=UPI003D0BDC96
MKCVLEIKPKYKEYTYQCILSDKAPDNLIYSNINNEILYSDWDYSIKIKIDCEYDDIKLYVNNKKLDLFINDDSTSIEIKENRPFINFYGYISFKVFIIKEDSIFTFYSGYFDIAVRKKINNDIIREMAKYILTYSKKYLFKKDNSSNDFKNTTKSKYRTFETQISIIDSIIKEYEINYKYFKSDKKYKLMNKYAIDDFEKVSNISNETIQFILSNPQYLSKVPYRTGIRYNKKNFEPIKTLIGKEGYDYDIYENRIVVSFLKFLYKEITDKFMKITIDNVENSEQNIVSEYCLSGNEIKNEMKFIFNEYNEKLKLRRNKIYELYMRYKNIIQCNEIYITNAPMPTQIFTRILHYRKIFLAISEWYLNGNYDMKTEKLLLTFPDVSVIYEYYLLLKINNNINNKYLFKNSNTFPYAMGTKAKYKNTEYENTFIFGENNDIVVYYQPVIYTYKNLNNIELFRNNSISFNMNELQRGKYYTPDYIIKIKRESYYEYIVIDAKWQYLDDVIKRSFKEIVYKYIFSLSTINNEDLISKVVVFNGKIYDEQTEYNYNFYNSSYKERNITISPKALILSINPNNKDYHKDIMGKLYNE